MKNYILRNSIFAVCLISFFSCQKEELIIDTITEAVEESTEATKEVTDFEATLNPIEEVYQGTTPLMGPPNK